MSTKRKLHSLSEKYEALLALDRGLTRAQVVIKFGVSRTTLQGWIKDRQKIVDGVQTGSFTNATKRMRTAEHPEVETALTKWMAQARERGWAVSGPILKEKAESLAKAMGIPDFVCSEGWLHRYKQRHDITFKTVRGESRAAPEEAIADWSTTVLPHILEKYLPRDIFNADETGLFFRMRPDKTLVLPGDDCKGGKLPKDRLTVLPCANMNGTEKLPLVVIGKSKNPRCFKKVKHVPVDYQANRRAWMTQDLFRDWLHRLDRKMAIQGRRISLILDNAPGHCKISLSSVELFFLPPNYTSRLQPMDQVIIRSLKAIYRREFVKLGIIETLESGKDFNWSVLDAILTIKRAWEKVTQTTIANCYRKAGFCSDPEAPPTPAPIDEPADPALSGLFERYQAQVHDTTIDEAAFTRFVNEDEQLATCASLTTNDIVQPAPSSSPAEEEEEEDDDEGPTLTQQQYSLGLYYMRKAAQIQGDEALFSALERSSAAWETAKKSVQPKITDLFKKAQAP